MIVYMCDKRYTDFSVDDVDTSGEHKAEYEIRNMDATGTNSHTCSSHFDKIIIERFRETPTKEQVVRKLP